MNLTFKGFLKAYCRELTGQNSLSFRKLVELAKTETPRVAEPMLMLAVCEKQEVYLAELTRGTWMEDSFEEALKFYKVGETPESFAASKELPSRYAHVWDAYRGKKDAIQVDRRLNGLMREKTLEAMSSKGLTCYGICKDLNLNKGNVYAYLNGGDTSKVSHATAQKIMNYSLSA